MSITSYAYKHYSGSGTGLRTLMDFYAYLNAKGDTFNLDYIRTECKKHRDYMFHTQIGVGKRLDGGRRRVKKYLWSFFRTAPAGQVRL